MASSHLPLCLRTADIFELAADRLESGWPGHAPIVQACRDFRRACEGLANNRGLAEITIAFVGPKNAGKSTLAGLLIQSEEKRARLKAGQSAAGATTRPTWVSARPPTLFDPEQEEFIPCHESEFVQLAFRYSLVDVPGFNERHAARSEAARRALDAALVKVLLIDRRELDSHEIARYLEQADGATIVPVVNLIRDEDAANDLSVFEQRLREAVPHAQVLPLVAVRDFDLAGEEARAAAGAALAERLEQAVAGQSAHTLAEPQLSEKLRRFKQDIGDLARRHLPATSTALLELHGALAALPAKAVETLLGSDQVMVVNVRSAFRAALLERTPIFFFPWRLLLSIANLIHGATDRLPLALLGSVPSLLTTAFTAASNVRQSREFAEERESGLRSRITASLKELAGPQLQAIDFALQRDLGRAGPHAPHTGVTCSAHLAGLETLQARSAAIFHRVLEKFAPSRPAAWLLALIGFAAFWSIFGAPLYGLYLDFAAAAEEVLARRQTTLAVFPSGTFSMLATSALLALLPMGLLLLFSVAFLTRRGKVRACIEELRAAHAEELATLAGEGILSAHVTEPQIDACRVLLTASE